MMFTFSGKALQEMREKKNELKKCDPQSAFEVELKEAQKSWYHFSKKKYRKWEFR